MENRKHPRIHSSSYQVDISDGQRFFDGTVENFSRFGLCIKEVSKRIDHRARRLSIVVSGDGKYFKMIARTRWTQEKRLRKELGVQILRAPWGWAEFVIAQEPPLDKPFAETQI